MCSRELVGERSKLIGEDLVQGESHGGKCCVSTHRHRRSHHLAFDSRGLRSKVLGELLQRRSRRHDGVSSAVRGEGGRDVSHSVEVRVVGERGWFDEVSGRVACGNGEEFRVRCSGCKIGLEGIKVRW